MSRGRAERPGEGETLAALDVLARLPGGHVLENRAEAISVALANSGQTLRA